MGFVTAKKTDEWVLNKAGVKRESSILWSHHEETREFPQLPGKRDNARNTARVHAGEEDHARPGWTTSRRGQDSPWKSQSE